jgi:hypothetical protein
MTVKLVKMEGPTSSSDCPETATDTDGAVIPCAFEAGHEGIHQFIRFCGVVNLCGICGETFQISETDPHWSSGRGPICPKRSLEPAP